MTRLVHTLLRVRPLLNSKLTQTRCYSVADSRPFGPGDSVLLRSTLDRQASPILLTRLAPGSSKDTHKGRISHDDIIGRRVRETVWGTASTRPKSNGRAKAASRNSNNPESWRIHHATLDDYVRFTPRLVTPLYPQDAGLIVSLMDLHVDPPHAEAQDQQDPPLEILEAGTGHGALTLFLSRAIHAANGPISPSAVADETALASWKASRRAIIHSVEISANHSTHANKIVKGFNHGLYHRNVDFHVSSVEDWVTENLAKHNGVAFLSRAFLDLPASDTYLSSVASALRTDATLIVFNPSISQIMECYLRVKKEGVPLALERVVEFGNNVGAGGREWDVRAVKPRAASKKEAEEPAESTESSDGDDASVSIEQPDESPAVNDWKMVCRPKVGDRVVGGGFLAVFRKERPRQRPQPDSSAVNHETVQYSPL